MKLSRRMRKGIFTALISAVTAIVLVGCSGVSPSDTINSYFEEITKSKSAEFTNLVARDIEKEAAKGEDAANMVISKETEKAIEDQVKKVTHTIVSEKVDGDKATVNIKVSGPNISSAFVNMIPKFTEEVLALALSEEAMDDKAVDEKLNKIFGDILIDELKKVKSDERTGNVSLIKKDGKWTIETNEEFMNLLMGKVNI